ncbi:MAG: glycosyltransferase family 2 protein [Candidatus Omnitrophica bacterium]|nr:glycosyltransferase family 2 protein [Candidatus Omnitrophota bacterium]
MNGKCPVTVALIVKNEERRLKECLNSLTWAREIVILDDMSTDRTVEIAREFTDKIYQRAMDIEGRQRNFAYAKAGEAWVLSIDADERVTPELAREIAEVLSRDEGVYNAYSIPIKTYLGNRWIKGAGYYPADKLRLFRNGKFSYEEARVHPRALLEGKCGRLQGDILHYSWDNLAQFIGKFNRETSLEAEKWIQDGRKVTLPNTMRKVVDRFLKNYFLKGGISDGFMGFLMSFFHSFYQLLTFAKYYAVKKGISKDL